MTGDTMLAVEITASDEISARQLDTARERLQLLDRSTSRRLSPVQLTLRHPGGRRAQRPYVADATVQFDGRLLAGHTAGRTASEAAESAADRLRRQLRRVAEADVSPQDPATAVETGLAALAGDLAAQRPEAQLTLPEDRAIVRRRTYEDRPQATLAAAADLLDLDQEFRIFRHDRTGEDVVVHRREDGRIGLLHPRGSALAGEDRVVVPEPSRYAEPMTLDAARAQLDARGERFLLFVDAADGRGRVLYLRHDGHYGLVEPPRPRPPTRAPGDVPE